MIGSIYRIIHLQSNITYVGSTMDTVRNRWQAHKSAYNIWAQDNTKMIVSIYPYMQTYGIKSFKCILIKDYDVSDKDHLKAYEQLWINKFGAINAHHAFNPLYKQQYKQQKKQYREANQDKIKQTQKQYREANQDKIKQTHKQYRDANQDKLKIKSQQYYKANLDKRKQYTKQMITCECGASFQYCSKSKHEKTNKHIDRITNLLITNKSN